MPIITPGLDALIAGRDASGLKGRKLALLTNQTGQTREGTSALQALRESGFNVLALFSPEHGPQGWQEGAVGSSHLGDGTPLFSLYGQTRRPTPAMLTGLEVIVCDLQDVGARFYTYASTLFEVMDACAPLGIAVVVLDRPNPLGGQRIEGPLIEPALMSFIGAAPLPVTHGMTLGELALFFRAWKGLNLELAVTKMEGWRRDMTWRETGLQWRQPSPNLPDFVSAAWYPGLCLLEFSDLSVGRGTEAPFQILAAPDLRPDAFLAAFNDPEIGARAQQVTPTRAVFQGQSCQGIRFSHPDGAPTRPVEFGLRVMAALRAALPDFSRQSWDKADKLLGNRAVLDALWKGDSEFALQRARADAQSFGRTRAPFLLY